MHVAHINACKIIFVFLTAYRYNIYFTMLQYLGAADHIYPLLHRVRRLGPQHQRVQLLYLGRRHLGPVALVCMHAREPFGVLHPPVLSGARGRECVLFGPFGVHEPHRENITLLLILDT